MLRPRRRPSSSSCYECSALPTFCLNLSPEIPYLDHSSSSCFEEDEDEYPIIEEVKSSHHFHPDYLMKQKNSRCTSLSATVGRLLAVACAFVLICCRMRTILAQKSDINLFDAPAVVVAQSSSSASAPQLIAAAPLQQQQHPNEHVPAVVGSSLTDEQRKSQALLQEKYGMGPYLVEFELNIWGDDHRPVPHYFTIELAPSDLMPATVYFFLEQVSNGLWSETSFYENLEHVIVSRPVSGNGQISKRQLFADAGLSRPPILEYSPYYPHVPYTLGLSSVSSSDSTPGEPATFYINKRHNVHHHNTNEACFAQVVVGRSTVDRLAAMPGSPAGRIRPVEIAMVRRIQFSDMSPRAMQEYLRVKSSSR